MATELLEQSAKQTTLRSSTGIAAGITADRFRGTANRLWGGIRGGRTAGDSHWSTAGRGRSRTGFRTAGVAGLLLEAAKQSGFGSLWSDGGGQNSHSQQCEQSFHFEKSPVGEQNQIHVCGQNSASGSRSMFAKIWITKSGGARNCLGKFFPVCNFPAAGVRLRSFRCLCACR